MHGHGIDPLIRDLALVLATAGFVTLLFHRFRQPSVVGYLLAGFLIGPYSPSWVSVISPQNVSILGDLGLIFVLFGLGLEFSITKLIRMGPTSLMIGLVELLAIFGCAILFGPFLGFSRMESFVLAGSLSISSTTIIFKGFREFRLNTKRFAETVLGILVVEDLVAVLLLLALSTMAATQQLEGLELAAQSLDSLFIVIIWVVAGLYVLPVVIKQARKWLSAETLLLSSLGVCLALVVVGAERGHSPALIALLTGATLAETQLKDALEKLIAPIRDLFSAIFFVSIGMMLNPHSLTNHWVLVLSMVGLAVGLNLSCGTLASLLAGQSLKDSVRIGISLTLLGEFSFIISSMGKELGLIREDLFGVLIATAVGTTVVGSQLLARTQGVSDFVMRSIPRSWLQRIDSYREFVRSTSLDSELKGILIRIGFTVLALVSLKRAFLASVAWKWVTPPLILLVLILLASPVRRILQSVESSFWKKRKSLSKYKNLAPWEAHVVEIELNSFHDGMGRTLQELEIRNRFGVNVIAIHRGFKEIIAPGAKERLLPGDRIVILGTDLQIDQFRDQFLHDQNQESYLWTPPEHYTMRRVLLGRDSPWLGKTIHEAKLSEVLLGLVVGLERQRQQILNPGSEVSFLEGDAVWIVLPESKVSEIPGNQVSN